MYDLRTVTAYPTTLFVMGICVVHTLLSLALKMILRTSKRRCQALGLEVLDLRKQVNSLNSPATLGQYGLKKRLLTSKEALLSTEGIIVLCVLIFVLCVSDMSAIQ
jgi:hypothetical protein